MADEQVPGGSPPDRPRGSGSPDFPPGSPAHELDAAEKLSHELQATPDASSDGEKELHEHIRKLEAELATYREQREAIANALVSARTFLAITNYASKIREEARREADLMLRKVHVEIRSRLARAERERVQVERELLQLRRITNETRAGLSSFLTTALDRLQLQEGEDAHATSKTTDVPEALHAKLEDMVRDRAES